MTITRGIFETVTRGTVQHVTSNHDVIIVSLWIVMNNITANF